MSRTSKVRSPIAIVVLVVAACALAPQVARGEAPYNIAWSRQIGTSTFDASESVAVDGLGNAYMSGWTHGSLAGPNSGGSNPFLFKYDPSGNVVWSRQIGSGSGDQSLSVAVDQLGNAYISGYTSGSLGGPNVGGPDAFLVKYDTSGSLAWSKQIGTSQTDVSYAVAVDGSGNSYVSGRTDGSLGGPNAGAGDAFLTKFAASGNVLWSRQIGTGSNEDIVTVAADALGNAYITGRTFGALGGPNAGGADVFLTKYNPSGSLVWTKQIGTSGWDLSESVAVDVLGNVYITGTTPGSLGGTSAGGIDVFLFKYDASGNVVWSRQFGTGENEFNFSVAVDDLGNAYVGGVASGSGPTAGSADASLTKFDSSGNFLWSKQIGSSSDDYCYSVALDGMGNAYISGMTTGSLAGPNAGNSDAFLVKFSPVPEPSTLLLSGIAAISLALVGLRSRRK